MYLCRMKRFVFFISLLCLLGCKPEKKNTNIPDAPIYFQVHLSNYSTFTSGMGSILVCPADLIGNDKAGNFGYSGTVLLVNHLDGGFGAYDACCTNPVCVGQKNKVSAEIRAKCPVCGSEFDLIYLSAGGGVVSGPAKYPLRRYRVNNYGSMLTITRYEY